MENNFATIQDVINRKAFFHQLSPEDMPEGMRRAGAPESEIDKWVKARKENEEKFMKEKEAQWQSIKALIFGLDIGILRMK